MSGAVRITLSRSGEYFALVDEEAEALVRQYRWVLHYCGKGKLYARAERDPVTQEKVRIYMHRLVAKNLLPPPPTEKHTHVDHGRGGSLDNRKCNLKWELPVVNRWGTARWISQDTSEQIELPPF